MRRSVLVAIPLLASLCLCGAVVWAAHYWYIQTADANGGDYSCTDLSSSDYPHISYQGYGTGTLSHAWWNGGAWATETVDGTTSFISGETSLVLDSGGHPHISYAGTWVAPTYHRELRYARWDGSSWGISTVEVQAKLTLYNSLALDSSDHAHIAYQDYNLYDLKYAVWSGSTWNIQTVDSAGFVGVECSLTLTRKEPKDQARIAYVDATTDVLKYAAWTGSAWAFQTVASNGLAPSLVLDSSDDPRIAYVDSVTNSLRFAAWNGASWDISTVDTSASSYTKPSLALDAAGLPRIAYTTNRQGDLRYAEWTGTAWETETIDASDSIHMVWYRVSLALTAAGDPQISYPTQDPQAQWGHLQYAVTRGPLAVRWPR
jgi:hypothetical protein